MRGSTMYQKFLFRFAVVSSIAALVLISPCSAAADPSGTANAKVSGQFNIAELFSRSVQSRACASNRCEYPISWTFQAHYPNRAMGKVSFTKVRFPKNIHRALHNSNTTTDLTTLPILLRGRALLRHAGEGGKTRTARIGGAILRDNGRYFLQFTLPSLAREGTGASRPVVFTTELQASNARLNARAKHASTFAFADMQCGEEPMQVGSLMGAAASSLSAPEMAAATYKVVYVTTDFDSQYPGAASCSGTACNNKIITVVDSAAVYYENQFGYTLEVAQQFGPTNHGSSTDSSVALTTFTNYNNSQRSTAATSTDLFQLFTGRTMNSSVVGLAYVGVTCSYKAYSDLLIQHVSDVANPVIAAHETGHTFNAQHTTSGIMSASLSFPLPTSFSAQSITEISTYLSQNYSRCIGGTSSSNPTPAPTNTVAPAPTSTPTGGGGGTSPIPTAIPTAAPTTTPTGGDGSGGTTPSTPPVSLKLSTSVNASGQVTLSTTISQIVPGCFVEIRGGATSDRAYYGTVLELFEPKSLKTVKRATVPYGVKKNKQAGTNVFFGARYVCNGTVEKELSPIKKISPNRGALARRLITKAQWLKKLKTGLKKASATNKRRNR